MLKIRLSRIGKRNEPHFRVVLADHRKAVKKKFIETLGHYHPTYAEGKQIVLNVERIKYWASKGVALSPTVEDILYKGKILDLPKRKFSKKKPKAPEKKAEEKSADASKEAPKTEAPKAEDKPETKKEEKTEEKK